ncbi:hypothetical protein V6N12_012880 [Hibiscus sabdariffa]|uniref:Uncharacterized protein n=1 Tax=Hibiscus sabdariffa TaxID=183260 RepID=A0ABR2EFP9_9ROSI
MNNAASCHLPALSFCLRGLFVATFGAFQAFVDALTAVWSSLPIGDGMITTGYQSVWPPIGLCLWLSLGVARTTLASTTMVSTCLRLPNGFSDGRQSLLLVHCLSLLAVLGPACPCLAVSTSCPIGYVRIVRYIQTPRCMRRIHVLSSHSAAPQCTPLSGPCDLHRWSLRAPCCPWQAPQSPVCDRCTPLAAALCTPQPYGPVCMLELRTVVEASVISPTSQSPIPASTTATYSAVGNGSVAIGAGSVSAPMAPASADLLLLQFLSLRHDGPSPDPLGCLGFIRWGSSLQGGLGYLPDLAIPDAGLDYRDLLCYR